jgi:hypothetical protein
VSTVLVAVICAAGLSANLAYILRPGFTPPLQCSPRWVPHSTLLAVGRGLLNGSAASFGLVQAGHPLFASIAEGATAGLLSGVFQLTAINERFCGYLHRARRELHRVAKWVWVQALFYGLVKTAGILVGGGPGNVRALMVSYVLTIGFGSAQYPWAAAIAANRAWKSACGVPRDRICLVADLQTVIVSVICVTVSMLSSVGVAGSRLFLLGVGIAGLCYYATVRRRRTPRPQLRVLRGFGSRALPSRRYQYFEGAAVEAPRSCGRE